MIFLIEQLFPDGIDQSDTIAYSNNNNAPRRIHENKLKILLKIQHATSMKFLSIRHTFEEIDEYVTRKIGHRPTKK